MVSAEDIDMDDLISIIVPIYNVERYMKSCIGSILSQTYKNIEIILVDDGSTDNSGSICDEYATIDKRIHIIHKENGGVSSARNAGLKVEQGKYVCFIDADDIVDKNYVIKLYEPFTNYTDNDISICECKIAGTKTEIKGNKVCDKNLTTNFKEFFSKLCLSNNEILLFSPCIKLYKSAIIKNKKIFFDEKLSCAEDVNFNFKYYNFVKKYFFQPLVLYTYFRHDRNSATETFNHKRVNDELFMLNIKKKWLKRSQIPYNREIFCIMLCNTLASIIKSIINDKGLEFVNKYREYRKFSVEVRDFFIWCSSLNDSILSIKYKITVKCFYYNIYFPIFIYFLLKKHI
jgi:glycosyltransferase involved in cell wall biosynthesis